MKAIINKKDGVYLIEYVAEDGIVDNFVVDEVEVKGKTYSITDKILYAFLIFFLGVSIGYGWRMHHESKAKQDTAAIHKTFLEQEVIK